MLLGAFNPKISQPAWFMRHELIQDQEGAPEEVGPPIKPPENLFDLFIRVRVEP